MTNISPDLSSPNIKTDYGKNKYEVNRFETINGYRLCIPSSTAQNDSETPGATCSDNNQSQKVQ